MKPNCMQPELAAWEFKANPKPKYIVNVRQIMPIRTGFFVL